MSRTLLSPSLGVLITLVALWLWFLVEVFTITGRRRPVLLLSSAVLVTAALLGIIVARFVTYT